MHPDAVGRTIGTLIATGRDAVSKTLLGMVTLTVVHLDLARPVSLGASVWTTDAAGGPAFWTTKWEIEFARLLSEIQRLATDVDLIAIMTEHGGVEVRDIDPITLRQESL